MFDFDSAWKGGRVVYGSSLENWRGRKLTVSSNLTPSAITISKMPLTDAAADLLVKQIAPKLGRTPSRDEVRKAHAECMRKHSAAKEIITCIVSVLQERRPQAPEIS